MINSTYSRAYTEVLEIIKYFPEEEYSKIPKEKIEFYKNNMDKNYDFSINPEIDLSEQNIGIWKTRVCRFIKSTQVDEKCCNS